MAQKVVLDLEQRTGVTCRKCGTNTQSLTYDDATDQYTVQCENGHRLINAVKEHPVVRELLAAAAGTADSGSLAVVVEDHHSEEGVLAVAVSSGGDAGMGVPYISRGAGTAGYRPKS